MWDDQLLSKCPHKINQKLLLSVVCALGLVSAAGSLRPERKKENRALGSWEDDGSLEVGFLAASAPFQQMLFLGV